MTTVAAPSTSATPSIPLAHRVRKGRWVLVLPLAILGVIVLAWGVKLALTTRAAGVSGIFFTVNPMDLDVKVVKDGEIQAVNNIEIASNVEGNNAIQQIVKEGSYVKKGEVLVTLDSAQIKQRIEDMTLDVEKAEADLTNAKEMKEIQVSQNGANLEAAQVAVLLAKLELTQYLDGSYPQQLKNAQTDLDMAQITLKNKEEDFLQTQTLHGKGFVTPADVKKAELELKNATNTVSKAQTALTVLTKYTHEMDSAEKKNSLAQAEQKLIRVEKENASNLTQKNADLQAKEQSLALRKRQLQKLKEQLEACTITAPADGLVVYSTSSERYGSGNQIQEGTQVRERQQILRLPDTSTMKVLARIQENSVPRLKVGQRASVKIVGVSKLTGATISKISVLSDSGSRWFNPDLKEYPVELLLDQTPPGLKPGIGAMVEIYVDRHQDVTAVPLSAIYSAGKDIYVFPKDGDGVKPTKVKLGDSNETHAIVTEGIKTGQQVLLLQVGQGRELLEQAGIKVEEMINRAIIKDKAAKEAAEAKPAGVVPNVPAPVRQALPNIRVPEGPNGESHGEGGGREGGREGGSRGPRSSSDGASSSGTVGAAGSTDAGSTSTTERPRGTGSSSGRSSRGGSSGGGGRSSGGGGGGSPGGN